MNIFLRELRAHYKGLIGWSAGMIFTIISGMGKFDTLGSGQTATEILKAFPKPMLVIFGISGFNVDTIIGYYGVMYLYIVLVATIHAAMIGSEVISKEERDRTSEFLYPKPISRFKIMTQKLAAALVNIIILNLVALVSSVLMVDYIAKNSANHQIVYVLMLALFFMQLLFFTLGAAMAGLFKNPKLPVIVSTSVLMSTYIIWVIMELNSNLGVLQYITPFHYFDAVYIINNGHLDTAYVVLSTILIIGFTVFAYATYNQRDLSV